MAAHHRTPRHIMIVDDDETLVGEISRALNDRTEFQICTFHLGQSARVALQQENFDLVIANWHMPDLNGVTLIREAQKRSQETVTILMSAFSLAEAKEMNPTPVA